MSDWVQQQMDRIRQEQAEEDQKGGPGSGHHGHAGRPGKRGGSVPGKGSSGGGGGGGGEASAPARGGSGKRTAASAYDEHSQAIKDHIGKIKSGIGKHSRDAKGGKVNWGYVGDMSRYQQRLGEILDFIQGAEEGTNWSRSGGDLRDRKLNAGAAYEIRKRAVNDMLKTLGSDLNKHRREWTGTDRRNWGYAGDLSHVRGVLKDIDDSLHGTGEYAE